MGRYAVNSLEGHGGGVCSCELVAGTLLSAGEDGAVKWWDVKSRALVWTEPRAHQGPIWDIKAAPSGGGGVENHVLTASSDSSSKVHVLASSAP